MNDYPYVVPGPRWARLKWMPWGWLPRKWEPLPAFNVGYGTLAYAWRDRVPSTIVLPSGTEAPCMGVLCVVYVKNGVFHATVPKPDLIERLGKAVKKWECRFSL